MTWLGLGTGSINSTFLRGASTRHLSSLMLDDGLIGAGMNADLLAFAHKAVQKFDLGAPAFGHVLTRTADRASHISARRLKVALSLALARRW